MGSSSDITSMRAEDVTDTIELALSASGWDQAGVPHKPRMLSDNGPGDLERQIGAFVDYYHQRYHESLENVTPADVYSGRDKAILREREKIKKIKIRQRRLQH